MGLDSVELLFRIEKEFHIEISNEKASQMFTIAEFTDTISKMKNVSVKESAAVQERFQKISLTIMEIFSLQEIRPDDKISLLFTSSSQSEWVQLKEKLDDQLPAPSFRNTQSKILNTLFFRKPNYDWNLLTVKDFIEGVLIFNFYDFVNFSQPQSKEEIYYGIAGLISKTMDIDVFEIKPWKRITTDLGIH